MNDTDSLISDFAARVRSSGNLPIVHAPYGARALVETKAIDAPERKVIWPGRPTPPSLPELEAAQVEIILTAAATTALHKVRRLGRTAGDQALKEAFQKAVKENCSDIIAAAESRIAATKAETTAKAKAKVAKEKERIARETTRRRLAEELRDARRRLSRLRSANSRADGQLKELETRSAREEARLTRLLAQDRVYPEIPSATIAPHKEGKGLPSESGIYFLWLGDRVDYVGKSVRLCDRAKLGTHHVLNERHMISFIPLPEDELTWAECYYIGITRPEQNFGRARKLAALAIEEPALG